MAYIPSIPRTLGDRVRSIGLQYKYNRTSFCSRLDIVGGNHACIRLMAITNKEQMTVYPSAHYRCSCAETGMDLYITDHVI